MDIFMSSKNPARKVLRRLRPILDLTNKIQSSIIGTILQNKVAAYWHIGAINFGDLITPQLLKLYGFTAVHSSPSRSKVVSTGSILQSVPEDYSEYIVGSGLIKDIVRPFGNAKILAVRGELTRQRIGAPQNVVLGDPGLLASKLLKQRQSKRYVLGIVPHYHDKEDPRIAMIQRRYRNEVLVIDVRRQPLAVFSDIDKCEAILSSSLHGIVTADSLGIQNAWILLSDKVVGKGFKFADYHSAFGTTQDPLYLSGNECLSDLLKSTRRPPEPIEQIKEALDTTFQLLRSNLTSE